MLRPHLVEVERRGAHELALLRAASSTPLIVLGADTERAIDVPNAAERELDQWEGALRSVLEPTRAGPPPEVEAVARSATSPVAGVMVEAEAVNAPVVERQATPPLSPGARAAVEAVNAATAAAEAAATEEALAAVAALVASEQAEAAAAQAAAAAAAAAEAAPAAAAGPPDATPPVVPVTRSRSGARQDVRDGFLTLYETGWEPRYLRLITGKSSHWCARRLHRVSVGPYPFERGSGGGEQTLRVKIEFVVPPSERSAFSDLQLTQAYDVWREAVGGPTVPPPDPRPKWSLPAVHFTPKQDSYLRRMVQGRAMEAAFGNEWSRQRVTRGNDGGGAKEVWVPHRRPTTTRTPATQRSDGAELVAFEFAFKRPPAMAVKTAFHGAFRKFRVGVDVRLSAEAAEPPPPSPPSPPAGAEESSSASARLEPSEGPLCAICLDPLLGTETFALKCGHDFHRGCLKEWVESQRTASKTCPICRHAAVPSRLRELLRPSAGRSSRRGEVAVVGVGASSGSGGQSSATGGAPQLRFEHAKLEILPALLDIIAW